jgi:hypothetical protein
MTLAEFWKSNHKKIGTRLLVKFHENELDTIGHLKEIEIKDIKKNKVRISFSYMDLMSCWDSKAHLCKHYELVEILK